MKLIENGSMVATICNSVLEDKTVFRLVMHNKVVIDQVCVHKGVGFYQDFIGMNTTDLNAWLNDDQIFSAFPEKRELRDYYNEDGESEAHDTHHTYRTV